MAVRVQALPKKSLDQTSSFMPHFDVNNSSWWNSNEQETSQSLSKNLTSEVEFQSPRCQEMKSLCLELQGEDSHSTHSKINSQQEVTALGKTNSQDQCASSGSVHDESYRGHSQALVTPSHFNRNPEYPTNYSQSEMIHPNSRTPFGFSDPYFSGLYTAYGPQVFPQMMGIAPTRVPLPLDLAEDGPIYVNAKQYHGILRRRQMRAKLEAQNRLVKRRKPYLHESRHLHALNRVRGSGGRFLSTRKLQESNSNTQANSNASRESVARDAPTSAFLSVRQDVHNGIVFQQHDHRAVSMQGRSGLPCNGTQLRTPIVR